MKRFITRAKAKFVAFKEKAKSKFSEIEKNRVVRLHRKLLKSVDAIKPISFPWPGVEEELFSQS